jgi:hypothetical protein
VSGWQDVALVVAGSLGPAGIATITIRSDRRKDRVTWLRDEATRRHDTYARFLAASTTVIADWSDVALMPPATAEEERFYDERRDVHYDQLNMVAALVRLTAVPTVAQAAEDMLAVVREARGDALEVGAMPDRAAAAIAWQQFDQRLVAARQAFIAAGRACDIRPPDDV